MIEGKFYTVAEVADILGTTMRQVQRLLSGGLLEGVRVGREWLIPVDEVERYLKDRRPRGRPPQG